MERFFKNTILVKKCEEKTVYRELKIGFTKVIFCVCFMTTTIFLVRIKKNNNQPEYSKSKKLNRPNNRVSNNKSFVRSF